MIGLFLPIAVQAVTTLAPPPPPPRKYGTFACEVRDHSGREFALSGVMRDWEKRENREIAVIAIDAPEATELSGEYKATFGVRREISLVKLGRLGLPVGAGMLLADFGPQGVIMLEHQAPAGSRGLAAYTGFCEVDFTTEG